MQSQTSMYSSRMRTARLLTYPGEGGDRFYIQGCLPMGVCLGGGGGGLHPGGLSEGVCIGGSSHPPWSAQRGICIQRVSASREDLPNPTRSAYRGGSASGGLHPRGICPALPSLSTEGVCIQGVSEYRKGLPNPPTPRSAYGGGVCTPRSAYRGGSASKGSAQHPQVSPQGGLHPGILHPGGLHRGICPTSQGLRKEGDLHLRGRAEPLPTVNRMTHRCQNIALPKTSFAAGKNEYTTFLKLFSSCKS